MAPARPCLRRTAGDPDLPEIHLQEIGFAPLLARSHDSNRGEVDPELILADAPDQIKRGLPLPE